MAVITGSDRRLAAFPGSGLFTARTAARRSRELAGAPGFCHVLNCLAMNTGTALRHTRIGDPVLS
jgi:hypothetical protein